MGRRFVALAALGVFAVLALGSARMPAFAAGMPGDGAPHPLRLTVGTLGTIGSLDPRTGDSQIAREVWRLQYPTLTSLDPKSLATAPGLALAWTPAPHNKGWDYRLRPGLTWSDGKPVTADDVVYSLEHARDDHWPYAGQELKGLTARALDARTVRITSTDAQRPPGLLLDVVPAHVFDTSTDLNKDVARLGVADGDWHVVTTSADSVELDAVDPVAGPDVKQIVFRTYPNANSLIKAIGDKQLDVVSGLPFADAGRLAALPNVTVDEAGSPEMLQAYRSDNVNGFLQRPEVERPVVFAPTIDQYSELYAAGEPRGEHASNTTYVVGAIIGLALCGIAYWIASRIRRHYVPLEETPVHG